MLTSKLQLGYVLTGGGGQAVQGGLSCPPPRISERMDNQQFLLHHLLQKYLVITDINFISVNLRCSLQRFSWLDKNGLLTLPDPKSWAGGKIDQPGQLAPAQYFGQAVSSVNSYCTIILEYLLVVRDINIISAKLRCLHTPLTRVTNWMVESQFDQINEPARTACPPPFRQG